MSDVTTPILQVQDLKVEFHTESGVVQAVNGVSFDLYPGETLDCRRIGSGKSVTNLTLMGLIPQPPGRVGGGQVLYDGRRPGQPSVSGRKYGEKDRHDFSGSDDRPESISDRGRAVD